MKQIVTISREFGSGGHEIARKVAQQLGYKLYDNELILEIAKNTKLSKELIEFYDEKPSTKTFFPVKTESIKIVNENIPLEKQIFLAEKEIMENAAKNENCIFVGRCSNYIFKNHPNSMHIFIYSNLDNRIKRKMNILNKNYKDIQKLVEEQDKKRILYYKSNTDSEWGNKANYDLCINSANLSIDEIVDIIVKLIK